MSDEKCGDRAPEAAGGGFVIVSRKRVFIQLVCRELIAGPVGANSRSPLPGFTLDESGLARLAMAAELAQCEDLRQQID